MIRRVLIANRGEIARRVIRTCKRLGIATVAVYSDVDAGAPHVREADSAQPIGPAPATESYLNIDRVIEAARRSGADAVHPGYGFLSENAAFADACEAAGLIFIGPPGGVIRRMGSKSGARAAVSAAGVPVVPGESPASQEPDDLAAAVARVGLPAVLKASAGGGGKGMRVVRAGTDVRESIAAARSEATRAFGNGALYVERLIERARHVEVQVIADAHGNVFHLLERDCTMQRRHQKVIEEAPAPRLDAGVRARLHAAAIAAARAVGYINAGTVEFLLEGDGPGARFYFLEMNTRLQVEHPITEAITGLDLVELQLQVAAGERLSIDQPSVRAQGHAIEARVYAEDSHRLLPQSGRLLHYREPDGPGIRVDSGVVAGQTITVHYDPLIAKVIAHADSRDQALALMDDALRRFEVLGLLHNIAFLRRLLAREEMRDVRAHTRFIEETFADLTTLPSEAVVRTAAAIAAFAAARAAAPVDADATDGESVAPDPWALLGRWEL